MKQSTDGLLAEEEEIEKEKSQGLWKKNKANISLPSLEVMKFNTTRDYKRLWDEQVKWSSGGKCQYKTLIILLKIFNNIILLLKAATLR